ncbi:MAG: sensor histidine kinase, partial [Candidatus Cyclobacteriaceae bacterium M2_1C_046]
LPEQRYDEIAQLYEGGFSKDGPSRYFEDQRLTKEGDTKYLLIGAIPVIIDGEPIAAFGIYTDITKLRTTEEHLQESLKEKEILLSEIHHRVKNNMAVVSGLMFLEELNFEEETTLNSILTRCRLRIHSMAKIHEKLYQSGSLTKLNFKDYISEQVDTIVQSQSREPDSIQINIDCEDIYLNINQAVPCALIINELVVNALQYAFEKGRKGELEVTLKSEGEMVTIFVADNGLGLPHNFEEMAVESTSQQIITQLVNQLNGDLQIESGKDKGTVFEIRFKKMNTSGSASNYFT